MKISVITVCFRAERTIAKTIESVKHQTYADIEYIIIDGGSDDGTMTAIGETLAGYPAKVISEPDRGIYDAMNKGVGLASGEYIHFLNAGDTYYDTHVIENAVCQIADTGADIVYGDIEYLYPDGSRERRNYDRKCSLQIYYLTGDCINHQAMFAARKLFADDLFDISLKICADRDWLMKKSKEKAAFHAMGFPVCVYGYDGVSVLRKEDYDAEAALCIRRHYPIGYPVFAAFEFMRHNRVLARGLHGVYRTLFIRGGKL
ncbi:MAG: glycosyltransferase [Ruminococcus flavefaciens]|nr:glycosyltransferase [Ruminococcus flavefaciens]